MLVPLVAMRWTVGSGAEVPASQVVELFDPSRGAPATGFVSASDATTIRFVY